MEAPPAAGRRTMKRMTTLPEELERLLARYDARVVELFAAAREAVLREAPGAAELVYDGYNAVAAAYTFTGRQHGAFCHVAAYSKYVNLGFNHGVDLDDPEGLLQGSGKAIRHVRVSDVARVRERAIVALIRQAVAKAERGDEGKATSGARIRAPRR